MMATGEVRIRFDFPGGLSDPEIWPDDCQVNAVLARVVADARERDKAFTATGRDWGLFLKRSGVALTREMTLAALGVQTGDVLVLKDEGELRARRDAYVAAARASVDSGFIEASEAAELSKLRAAAQMDAAGAAAALGAAGLEAGWIERIIAEKEQFPDELAGYRKALQGVPRDGAVPEDLHRALATLRAKQKITPDMHRRLCKKLGCTDVLAERLLVDLPPKEDGLGAYRKELEFLKKQSPQTTDELKVLTRLQKQHKISPSEHQAMALEIGFTAQESELIWDGIPPRMVEREAALEAYRSGVKAAWMDQNITATERASLQTLRTQHKISAIEHMKVCKELKIPNELAESLLRPPPAPTRAVGRLVAAGAVVAAAVAAAAYSLNGHLTLPGMRPPAPAAVASRTTDSSASPAPDAGPSTPVPEATPVPAPTSSPRDTGTKPPDGPPAVKGRKGVVQVNSTPMGAVVVVDGKVRGVTPIEITDEPGDHVIAVKADGYFMHRARVLFVSGERRYHKAELKER